MWMGRGLNPRRLTDRALTEPTMAQQFIFANAAGGWTLVEVPKDGPNGQFYSVPHPPDLHFNTRDEAMKALRLRRRSSDDDAI